MESWRIGRRMGAVDYVSWLNGSYGTGDFNEVYLSMLVRSRLTHPRSVLVRR